MSVNNAHYWSICYSFWKNGQFQYFISGDIKYLKSFGMFCAIIFFCLVCVNILKIIAVTFHPLDSLNETIFIISEWSTPMSFPVNKYRVRYFHIPPCTSWWVEAVALALPSFRKFRTSRSEDKTRGNHISQQSGGEVAIVISVLFCLHFFS